MVVLATLTARVTAQEHNAPAATRAPAHPPAEQTATDPHVAPAEGDRPVVPTDAAAWAGAMLIIIIAMFLMAAVIGPMVRMEMANHQTEDPAAEDDPHASHHGHSHGHVH